MLGRESCRLAGIGLAIARTPRRTGFLSGLSILDCHARQAARTVRDPSMGEFESAVRRETVDPWLTLHEPWLSSA